MAVWTPTHPKTVIARAIAKRWANDESSHVIVTTTTTIADDLGAWLNDILNDMSADDPRVAGYVDLAERLTAR